MQTDEFLLAHSENQESANTIDNERVRLLVVPDLNKREIINVFSRLRPL